MFVGDWIGGRLGSEKLCPRRKLGFRVVLQRAKWFRALFICETWRRRPPGKPQSLAGSQGLQALINESLRRIWCAFGEGLFFSEQREGDAAGWASWSGMNNGEEKKKASIPIARLWIWREKETPQSHQEEVLKNNGGQKHFNPGDTCGLLG